MKITRNMRLGVVLLLLSIILLNLITTSVDALSGGGARGGGSRGGGSGSRSGRGGGTRGSGSGHGGEEGSQGRIRGGGTMFLNRYSSSSTNLSTSVNEMPFPYENNLIGNILCSTFRQSSRRSTLVWTGILVHSTPLSLKFTFSSHKIYLSSNSNSYSAPKKNNPIRVKIKLHIKITAVNYNKNSSAIRVKGKSLFSNEHVKASVFHTLEIKNKEFNLVKQNWDEDSINSLAEASNRTNRSYLAVVLMQEGLAHIFSVGKTLTVTLFSIDRTIGANKFFEMIFSAFNKHVDFDREQQNEKPMEDLKFIGIAHHDSNGNVVCTDIPPKKSKEGGKQKLFLYERPHGITRKERL
ncbi:hypothetical protein LguiB_009621 [Lonicera macranthoides]